jgi:hypothetical protein
MGKEIQDNDTKLTKEPGHAGILVNHRMKPQTGVTIADQLMRSDEKEGEYDNDRYAGGADAP